MASPTRKPEIMVMISGFLRAPPAGLEPATVRLAYPTGFPRPAQPPLEFGLSHCLRRDPVRHPAYSL